MLNLDTHILLFLLNDQLTPREAQLIRLNDCGISPMVLWEISKLHSLGRILISLEDADLLRLLPDLIQWPVTWDVCRRHRELDFRSDPVDEVVAATSLAYGVPLLTRDRKLLASKVIPLAV